MGNALGEKKSAVTDWHPADVVAKVRRAGTSLRKLSQAHGYAPQSLQVVLRKQWPNAERIVAAAIGYRPQSIWPSRYDERGQVRRTRFSPTKKHSTGAHP